MRKHFACLCLALLVSLAPLKTSSSRCWAGNPPTSEKERTQLFIDHTSFRRGADKYRRLASHLADLITVALLPYSDYIQVIEPTKPSNPQHDGTGIKPSSMPPPSTEEITVESQHRLILRNALEESHGLIKIESDLISRTTTSFQKVEGRDEERKINRLTMVSGIDGLYEKLQDLADTIFTTLARQRLANYNVKRIMTSCFLSQSQGEHIEEEGMITADIERYLSRALQDTPIFIPVRKDIFKKECAKPYDSAAFAKLHDVDFVISGSYKFTKDSKSVTVYPEVYVHSNESKPRTSKIPLTSIRMTKGAYKDLLDKIVIVIEDFLRNAVTPSGNENRNVIEGLALYLGENARPIDSEQVNAYLNRATSTLMEEESPYLTNQLLRRIIENPGIDVSSFQMGQVYYFFGLSMSKQRTHKHLDPRMEDVSAAFDKALELFGQSSQTLDQKREADIWILERWKAMALLAKANIAYQSVSLGKSSTDEIYTVVQLYDKLINGRFYQLALDRKSGKHVAFQLKPDDEAVLQDLIDSEIKFIRLNLLLLDGKKRYPKAQENAERSLKHLFVNGVNGAEVYNLQAQYLTNIDQYDEALLKYQKALDVCNAIDRCSHSEKEEAISGLRLNLERQGYRALSSHNFQTGIEAVTRSISLGEMDRISLIEAFYLRGILRTKLGEAFREHEQTHLSADSQLALAKEDFEEGHTLDEANEGNSDRYKYYRAWLILIDLSIILKEYDSASIESEKFLLDLQNDKNVTPLEALWHKQIGLILQLTAKIFQGRASDSDYIDLRNEVLPSKDDSLKAISWTFSLLAQHVSTLNSIEPNKKALILTILRLWPNGNAPTRNAPL
jgi:tetratricopeptide (TPR) repeat protein